MRNLIEGRSTISACMMVKNEESRLARCLDSIHNVVDEIIIVDTGSIDNTKELALKYPKVKLFEHPWENNFSLHRNQSLKYATGDFVFIIDADEEVVFNQGFDENKFREWLNNWDKFINAKNIVAGAVELNDIQKQKVVMKFNSARIFKNGEVYYDGVIHNNPVFEGEGVLCPSIRINHYGYDMTPEQTQAKYERTGGLLKARLAKNPNDVICWFYLCQMYCTRGMLEESIEAGEKYMAMRRRDIAFNHCIYFTMISNYLKTNNIEKVKTWLDEALANTTDSLDIALAQLEYGIITNKIDYVFNGGRNYINIFNIYQTNPEIKGNNFVFTFNYEILAYVVAQYSLCIIDNGLKTILSLQNILPNTSDKYTDNLLSEVTSQLSKMGITLKVGKDA